MINYRVELGKNFDIKSIIRLIEYLQICQICELSKFLESNFVLWKPNYITITLLTFPKGSKIFSVSRRNKGNAMARKREEETALFFYYVISGTKGYWGPVANKGVQ